MSQLFASGGQNTGVSALASVLPMNTQNWSPLGWTGWISLQSKGISRVFSNTTVQKHPCMRDRKRDTDVKNRLLDSVGEGEGGMIWENGIETFILSRKKRIASLGSIQDTGCLGLVHWDDPERWYGEEWWEGGSGLGTHVHLWWIHVNVWQNQYSIVK